MTWTDLSFSVRNYIKYNCMRIDRLLSKNESPRFTSRLFVRLCSTIPRFTSRRFCSVHISSLGTFCKSSPVQSSPVHSSPVQSSPVQSSPVQSSPVQSSPVQSSPVQSSPVQSSPVQSSPVQSSPVQSSPVQSSPVQSILLQLRQLASSVLFHFRTKDSLAFDIAVGRVFVELVFEAI